MNTADAAKLLTKCAAFDNRQPSREAAMAWAEALTSAHITLEDASAAITAHYRESTDFIQPAHVIRLAKAARKLRIAAAGQPDLPPGLTWERERDYRRAWLAAVGSGATPTEATATVDARGGITREIEHPRPIGQLIAGIGKAVSE